MKKVKRVLSVILAVVMVLATVPMVFVSATQDRTVNFYRNYATSDSPGQFMVNIALAQLGRSTSSMGYSEAWCANFVSDCAKLAGQSDAIPAHSYVPTLWNNILNAGGREVYDRKAGDIIFYDCPSCDTDGDGVSLQHVGIVMDGTYSVEGNLSSSVKKVSSFTDSNGHTTGSGKVKRRYLRPSYHNSAITYSEPPTAPTNVKCEKEYYRADESIHFTWDAVENATEYWVYMWKDGSQIYATSVGNSTSHGASPMSAGHYTLIVRAGNPAGFSNGPASVSFTIFDSAPGNPSNLKSDQLLYSTDESIHFTWDAVENATEYWVYMWKDGSEIYATSVGKSTSHGASPMSAGHYTLIVRAGNPVGFSNGPASVSFDIYDSAPQKTVANLNKTTLTLNEEGILTWTESENAEYYWISCWRDSEQVISEKGSGFSKTIRFDRTGNYAISVVSCNKKGETSGEWIHFSVVDNTHTHSYTLFTTQAATCIATGIKTYTCSCGDSYTETIPINASNHVNTKNVAAVASTCTAKGYTAGVYCNDCKKYISGHAEQPLAAHKTTTINAKDATYDADGYTGDTYCTVCRQTLSYGTTIPKLVKPDEPTNPTQPTQPTQPQQQSGSCKYCGQNHTGFPGIIVGFFHSILALFGLRK